MSRLSRISYSVSSTRDLRAFSLGKTRNQPGDREVGGGMAKLGEDRTLSGRIKLGMVNAGIHNQSELARRAKLSRQAVHKYLNGENEKLTPEKLFSLADALKVNPRWLAFGPPHSPTPPQSVDPSVSELIHIKETLDQADSPEAHNARDNWISQGRGLVRILTPASANNPFPQRKVKPK